MTGRHFYWIGVGLVVGIALGVIGLIAAPGLMPGEINRNEDSSASLVPAIGQPAPDFELISVAGDRFRLSDWRGEIVLLNYWATWCAPCRAEMPLLQEVHGMDAGQLQVLAVNHDEAESTVRQFIDELGVTFPVLLDPEGKTARLYRVRAFPTTFFIDRSGIVRFEHLGPLHKDQLNGYLERIKKIQ